MLKNKIFFLSLATIFYTSSAYAIDARSTALGGTTQGLSNGAFSSLRNPASMTDLNWGHFILPLSPNITLGSTINVNSFISSASNLNKLLTTVKNNISNSRIEANINLPILGYSGIPFQNFKLFNKQIAIGFNIVANSNNYFSTDKNKTIVDAFDCGTSIYNFANNDIKNMNSLFSTISQLINYNFNKFNNIDFGKFEQVSSLSQEVKQLQDNQIKTILDLGPSLLKNLENLEKQIINLVDNLSKAEKIQNAGQIVADGHLTIMTSAASKVYSNDIFDISVGVNLKGFLFPYNQKLDNIIPISNLQNPSRDVINSLAKNTNLLPIASKVRLELGEFKSSEEIKNFINNKIDPLIQDSKKLVENLGNLDNNITNILELSKTNPVAIVNELPSARQNLNLLQTNIQSINSKLNINELANLSNTFIQTLSKDFQNVKINVEQYTDVSPFGLGLDLGLQSRIYKYTTVGLFLQNPFVLWPAKVRNISIVLLNPTNTNVFDFENISDLKTSNYNLSEPFAIKFGGSHNLEYLHPLLTNTIVLADIDQVFNGRNIALHLGIEKGFKFNELFSLALRLGGQLGGIASMLTAGFGIQGGPFNLDLALASGNFFNPINSNGASATLSTSLNF